MTGTAIVVSKDGTKSPLHFERIQTKPLTAKPKKATTHWHNGIYFGTDEERINLIALTIRKRWRQFSPDLVLLEGHSFGSKGRALSGLHELHGVVKHRLHLTEAPWLLVAPSAVKEHATGNGNASKAMMLEAAQSVWPECPNNKDADEADAYWLCDFGIVKYDDLVEVVRQSL